MCRFPDYNPLNSVSTEQVFTVNKPLHEILGSVLCPFFQDKMVFFLSYIYSYKHCLAV